VLYASITSRYSWFVDKAEDEEEVSFEAEDEEEAVSGVEDEEVVVIDGDTELELELVFCLYNNIRDERNRKKHAIIIKPINNPDNSIIIIYINLSSRSTHSSQILSEPPHFYFVRVYGIFVFGSHIFFYTFFKFKERFVALFVSAYGAYIGSHKPSEYTMEVVRVTTLETFGALGVGATYRF